MSFLNLDGGSCSSDIVKRLNKEKKSCSSKSIGFDAVDVDESILQAAVVLFRDRQQKQHLHHYYHEQQQQLQQQQQQLQQQQLLQQQQQQQLQQHQQHQLQKQQQLQQQQQQLEKQLMQQQHNQPFQARPILQIPQEHAQHLQQMQMQQQQMQMCNGMMVSTKSSNIDINGCNSNGNTNLDNNNNNNNANANTIIDSNIIRLEKLCIVNCPVNPYLEYLIEAAMGMDLFQELELQGNIGEEEDEEEMDGEEEEEDYRNRNNVFALDALGFRMRFSRRLRKLELLNLPMSRDHAESLMYGIETNKLTGTGCRLDTLFMEGVRFVDDDDDVNDSDSVVDQEEDEEQEGQQDDDENNMYMAEHDVDRTRNKSRKANNSNDGGGGGCGDGTIVIQELCEGFPNNSTLRTIEIQRCYLNDKQIALLFDSLAYHRTLTSLNLSENYCRNLGLEALNRMLVTIPPTSTTTSPSSLQQQPQRVHCTSRLECLDLSYQFITSEGESAGGGYDEISCLIQTSKMQLNILTKDCTTIDADDHVYLNLRKLVLCGNQIDDSDMKDLVFLIRHRFPKLEELDLRFNDITTDGLKTFADYSDPNSNHECFLTHNTTNTNNNNNNHIYHSKDHFPPPSSRLRTIRLTNNPLVMTNETSVVLLNLLKLYPELQQIQSNLEWEDGTYISRYIQHLLDINRAGRVLLLACSNGNFRSINNHNRSNNAARSSTAAPTNIDTSQSRRRSLLVMPANKSTSATATVEGERKRSDYLDDDDDDETNILRRMKERRLLQQRKSQRRPIPLSVWPLVLARLTRKARFPHYVPKKNSLNGMFYLIRHGPIVVEQMSSRKQQQQQQQQTNNNNGSSEHDNNNNDGENNNNNSNKKRKRGDPALGGYATIEDFLRCELGVNS